MVCTCAGVLSCTPYISIPLYRLLPKARVVYCSATGVSDVKNLAYMERLGLWGDGTAYKTFQNFLDTITQRGLGAAEMLAMEMKSAGVYVSRGLSFRQAEVGPGVALMLPTVLLHDVC